MAMLNKKNDPSTYRNLRQMFRNCVHVFIMKLKNKKIKPKNSYLEVLFQKQLFRPLSGSHQAVMTDYYSVINDRAPVRHRYPRYSCFFSLNIAFKSSDIFKNVGSCYQIY